MVRVVGHVHRGDAVTGKPDFSTNVALSTGASVAVRMNHFSHRNRAGIDRRRLLGAYYTPESFATILVRWALANSASPVLDPSFGGCAFLNAAAKVLAEKGVSEPGRLVFGVDVDPACVEYVRNSKELSEENCIIRDFLELSPREVPGAPFRAVVGNPPYIRHHWLKGATRSAAIAAATNSGVSLPARASTWAYFLVHALSFLAKDGRLAMLVPEAILQADYATPIREALGARFKHVALIHVRDRLFARTSEPVVVVAAAGYGKRGKVTVDSVSSVENIENIFRGSKSKCRASRMNAVNGRRISAGTIQLLEELKQNGSVHRMAGFATVQIGFVTGANSHFIRSYEDLRRLELPRETWLPVVARTQWLSGLKFTREDHERWGLADRRAFLVRPAGYNDAHEGVQRWIAEGLKSGMHERFKCARRAAWFRVELPQVPDAFATCTRFGSPLLVLNRSGYRCSNALHSVRWHHDLTVAPEVVAVGFLTSLVSVWAELNGRRYGGGVLKVEPGTLNKVPVPLVPDVESAFDELDGLVRAGQEDRARMRADEIVLADGLNLPKSDVRRL